MKRLATPSSPLALYAANRAAEHLTFGEGEAPLVLGHALGSSREMWDEVLPLLPEELPVILWEQPGHGESGLLSVTGPNAQDIAAALNSALVDLGITEAHIAGLSLGGMVSLAYAEEYPEDTLSLGILGSGPALPHAQNWFDRAHLVEQNGLSGLVDGTMERWFTPGFSEGSGRTHVAKIRDIFLETDPAGYAQCCRVLANTDLSTGVDLVSAPALVLTGEDDQGTPPSAALQLATDLASPLPVVIVEDARHLTAVEQPGPVANALESMVATV